MGKEDKEWKALIEKILHSEDFVRAETCSDLLRLLFEHKNDRGGVDGKTLAEELYKKKKHNDPERAFRVLCIDLRKNLWRYSGSKEGQEQKWSCLLPDAVSGQGYKLRFIDQWDLPGLTGAFWQAHRQGSKSPIVAYSEPLFFRDRGGNRVFRWFDVNFDDPARELAMKTLHEKHPETKNEDLHPSYLYVLSGEINARQYIREWFEDVAGISVPALNSRRSNSTIISSTCPILLGNPQVNSLMRHLLQSAECKQLSYRFDNHRFGVTCVVDANDHEKKALGQLPDINVHRESEVLELLDNAEAEGYVFGVVTRMPNPYGEGAVTMISSHNTRVVEQIARTLTDDRRLGRVALEAEWPMEKPVPRFFQGLFKVRMGPVNIDAEAREPELVGARIYLK